MEKSIRIMWGVIDEINDPKLADLMLANAMAENVVLCSNYTYEHLKASPVRRMAKRDSGSANRNALLSLADGGGTISCSSWRTRSSRRTRGRSGHTSR